MAGKTKRSNGTTANLGFEAKLWLTADTFEEHRAKLIKAKGDYARRGLDKQRLGELIDVLATIELTAASEGPADGRRTRRSADLLGRVYEFFLTRFAWPKGKKGRQFCTPSCVVRCLVAMLARYKARIYDPACGSDGMFVQSEKFVEAHGGKLGEFSIYSQEHNAAIRRHAVMNLALRGIEADFGPEHADYVLAITPYNDNGRRGGRLFSYRVCL